MLNPFCESIVRVDVQYQPHIKLQLIEKDDCNYGAKCYRTSELAT